jgi:hypothetical protein
MREMFSIEQVWAAAQCPSNMQNHEPANQEAPVQTFGVKTGTRQASQRVHAIRKPSVAQLSKLSIPNLLPEDPLPNVGRAMAELDPF